MIMWKSEQMIRTILHEYQGKKIFLKRNLISKNNLETKKLGNVEIIIIFIAHDGVWHEKLWNFWKQNDQRIRFVIHQDKERSNDLDTAIQDFGNYVPNPENTVRGELSVVRAILKSLQYAKYTFATATHFFIFSGDSLPTRNIKDFIFLTEKQQSILQFTKHFEDDGDDFVTHHMEMMLYVSDVEILLGGDDANIFNDDGEYQDENNLVKAYNSTSDRTPNHMMDEFVIGNYLFDSMKAGSSVLSPLNKSLAGWIAISSDTKSLKSSIIVDNKQCFTAEESEEILFPDPNNGSKHFRGLKICTKDITFGILFDDEPWNEYFVFRKISPKFVEFLDKMKNKFTNQPIGYPIDYKIDELAEAE